MTPKLYDEVNAKLSAVWGEYAGWAHSVRVQHGCAHRTDPEVGGQVLFTADLKAFSSYGLPTPMATPTNEEARPVLLTPSSSTSKRKMTTSRNSTLVKNGVSAGTQASANVSSLGATAASLVDEASLADRVKRRRRTMAH